MNQCLEFSVTMRDMFHLSSDLRSRTQRIVYACIAVMLVAGGTLELAEQGVSFIVVLYFIMAGLVAFPTPFTLFILPKILSNVRRISVSDDGLKTEWNGGEYKYRWSSFSKPDAIQELQHNFVLESGRGVIVIPKRAFASTSDLTEFRDFIANHLRQAVEVVKTSNEQ